MIFPPFWFIKPYLKILFKQVSSLNITLVFWTLQWALEMHDSFSP